MKIVGHLFTDDKPRRKSERIQQSFPVNRLRYIFHVARTARILPHKEVPREMGLLAPAACCYRANPKPLAYRILPLHLRARASTIKGPWPDK